MGTKTISIRDEVYNLPKSMKKEDESSSDVIGKLAKRRKSDLIHTSSQYTATDHIN